MKSVDLKDLIGPLKEAEKLLLKTANGLPDKIKALQNITKDEAELLKFGSEKINGILGDIDKEMKTMSDFLRK